MKPHLPLSLLSALVLSTSHAATVSWSNDVDGSWGDTTKWDSGALPGAGDQANVLKNATIVINGEFEVATPHLSNTSKTKTLLGAADGNSRLIFNERFFLHQGTIIFGDGINPLYVGAKDMTNVNNFFNGEISVITVHEKVTLEAYRFILGNWANHYTNLTLKGGQILIRGNSTSIGTSAPLLLGHWDSTAEVNKLTVESGLLDVSDGLALIGWTGNARLTVKGGVANFQQVRIHFNNGQEVDRSFHLEGGRVNIGAGGMTMSHTDRAYMKYNLGNGVLGAYADWSSAAPMTLTTGQTTIDTLDSKDNATARTISLTGILDGAGGIIKDQVGTLTLGGANTYTGATTVKKGVLNVTGSINTTSMVTLHNGATIQGAGIASYTKDLTVRGDDLSTPAIWNGAGTINNLVMANSTSALQVNGNMSVAGNLNITLDTAVESMGPLVQMQGGLLSFSASSEIIINAYNPALDQVGEGIVKLNIITPSQLDSTNIPTITWNRTDEKYTFDPTQFSLTGSVSWTSTEQANYLLTVSEGAVTPFVAPAKTAYVGAKEAYVIFSESNTYTPYDGNTRLTDGNGTFVFQPQVAGSGALFVLGMGRGGQVVLTNNNNAQTRTEIADTRLVVDTSLGSAPATSSVNALGAGAVKIYGTSATPGILELRAGGDTASGTFTLGNAISLNGISSIEQSGANPHLLTGGISVTPGTQASLVNNSTSDLLISGPIQVDSAASLDMNGNSGKIVLSGARSSDIAVLNVLGTNGVELRDGYQLTTSQVNLNGSSPLSLQNGSHLSVGSGGITQGAGVSLSNSTINTLESAIISPAVDLDGSSTIVTSGGSNTTSIEGGITGTGDLIKEGEGKLVVYATSTPSTTGSIILRQGALQLGQNTAQLMEDGQTLTSVPYTLMGSLDVESGTLSGIIDANGNDVHFGSGSVLSLAIDSSDYTSSVTQANNITIDPGATVKVNTIGQGWTVNTDYIIISANNSLSGAEMLLDASGEFAFIDVDIRQTAKNVILTLSRKIPDIPLNGKNEATIFPIINELVTDSLEGRYGNLSHELLKEMQYISKMSVSQLGDYVSRTASSAASLYSAMAGQVSNTTRQVQALRNRVTQLDPALFDQYQTTDNRNIWVESFLNYADVDSTNYAPGYQLDSWGVHTGIAFSLGEKAYIGTGFGYFSGETKTKGGYGKTESNTYNMDLFGRYKDGDFSLSAVVTGGFSSFDYTRHTAYQGTPKDARAKADGSQVLGMVEAAYDFQLNDSGTSIIQPLVNVSAGYVRIDAFDETGMANVGYHVERQQVAVSTLGAGLRYIYTEQTPDSFTPWRAEFRAMVTQDVGDTSYEIKANYLGSRNHVMKLDGVPLERTAFIIGASGVIPLGQYTSFFGDVTGEFRSGQNSVSANIGFSLLF